MVDPFRRWPEHRFDRLIVLEAALYAHAARIASAPHRPAWALRIIGMAGRIGQEANRLGRVERLTA